MLLIPPHDGPALTAEQVKALDDEFFTARPLAYFASRVRSLLDERDPAAESGPGMQEFLQALGVPESSPVLDVSDEDDRRLQITVDSMSVRHHAAEALVRLLHAVTAPRDDPTLFSTWAAIVQGHNGLHAVVRDLRDRLRADPHLLSQSFFQPGVKHDTKTVQAFEVAYAWVQYAMELVTSNDLTVNDAHNKVKHGLAVRARGDVLVNLIPLSAFDHDGNVGVTAMKDSTPIVDRPVLTYLARPYPRSHGLEVSSLLIDAPQVLAEAWMMAVIHAAVFHVAARQHFGAVDADIAPYPALHLGPTPDVLIGEQVRGYRGVLTSPLNAATEARRSGLFFGRWGFRPMTIDFEWVARATIVDDGEQSDGRTN